MKVAVLGSGSRGNAIAVTADGSTVLVDAGFGIRTLTRRAQAARIDLTAIRAILLTHEHGDHARGATALARRVGCPIYASRGTLSALRGASDLSTVHLPAHRPVQIGPFRVAVCRTSHDAVEPVAVSVEGPRRGQRVGIAYDVGRATPAIRSFLRGVGCLIVEANHDDHMLRVGPYPPVVQQRIAGPAGHLSNREAAELVAGLVHQKLSTVVLAHLSDQCNQAELALRVVRRALGTRRFRGRLLVAAQDGTLGPFAVGTDAVALDLFD